MVSTDCLPVPEVVKASRRGDATVLGSVVSFECDVGFTFSDYSIVQNSSCESAGTWTAVENECFISQYIML